MIPDHNPYRGAPEMTTDSFFSLWFSSSRTFSRARSFANDVKVGMVGVGVPIPVPVAYHSFGGWRRSVLGDRNAYSAEGIGFYTKVKTMAVRWPSGIKSGAEFVITMMK